MTDVHSAFPQPAHAKGQALSEHGHVDMSEHLKTWKGFSRLIRWGIAAIATAHDFAVASRDTGAFIAAGITVIDPWAGNASRDFDPS